MHIEEKMQEILNNYSICMNEIKLRTNAINSLLKKQTTTLYPYTNTEFICLQIRKILELIALANLVVNKDEYEKLRTNFNKDWNAKRILETIKKVNPNYFPKSITRKILNDSKIKYEWLEKTKDVLTEDLFISIYDEMSNIIHSHNPFNKDLINIDEMNIKALTYINLIVNTLNEHNTVLCNKNIINCNMNAIDITSNSSEGKVSVHYFGKCNEDLINE